MRLLLLALQDQVARHHSSNFYPIFSSNFYPIFGAVVRKLFYSLDTIFALLGLRGIEHGEKGTPQLWRGGHTLRRDNVQRSRRAGC